ncbi:proteophosphoglycan 5 [Candidatus Koribacter versatilis Ellin345]|uniref:Proteophosphoglycan 5 n=2 Tax=Candidatus Korobacter versatilis TaxID=658062 RepID=Q1IPS5_KORVE|nr:proteophosphoglycan 5 [Candidatus Koribacter versatilis Ellin345]
MWSSPLRHFVSLHEQKVQRSQNMRKLILTAVALMCSGLWAVAQSSSTPSSASPSGQSAGAPSSSSSSAGAATTVDGCLSGSAGAYTIKDKATGTTYNLSGPTSSLSAHVGHEIQVVGTTASASSGSSSGSTSSTSSTPSSASGSSGNQTLNVTSAKMVSSSCSNQ